MNKNSFPRVQRRQHGFTLLELMMVVAVVAILSAIAYPSYQEYIRRGHRAEARAGLLQAAQWLERAATATGSYPTTLSPGVTEVQNRGYSIRLDRGASGSAFTLLAVRQGPQAGDKCGDFTLTHRGERGLRNQARGMQVNDCWNK